MFVFNSEWIQWKKRWIFFNLFSKSYLDEVQIIKYATKMTLGSISSQDKQERIQTISTVSYKTIFLKTRLWSLFSTNRNYSSFFIVIDPLLAANILIICLCKSSVSKHPIDILRTCKIPKPAVKSNSPRYKGISPQTDLGFALKNVVPVTSGYIRNLPKCSR